MELLATSQSPFHISYRRSVPKTIFVPIKKRGKAVTSVVVIESRSIFMCQKSIFYLWISSPFYCWLVTCCSQM
jgi:hypothetical protein